MDIDRIATRNMRLCFRILKKKLKQATLYPAPDSFDFGSGLTTTGTVALPAKCFMYSDTKGSEERNDKRAKLLFMTSDIGSIDTMATVIVAGRTWTIVHPVVYDTVATVVTVTSEA